MGDGGQSRGAAGREEEVDVEEEREKVEEEEEEVVEEAEDMKSRFRSEKLGMWRRRCERIVKYAVRCFLWK
jgi:hypothetical protein